MDKNYGKIIRLLLAIATTINDGAIMAGIAQFQNETVNKIYMILSFVATVIVIGINHWYNNDYTEEARIGTNLTRQLKLQNGSNEVEEMTEFEAMRGDEDGETEGQ